MILVLEGPDGVGKTTVAHELERRLKKDDILCGIVYQPNGWDSFSDHEKSIAKKGMLICDRERYFTQNVYTKVLPRLIWNFPLEQEPQEIIPPADSGIKVFRTLLETENGWPLKDVEYRFSDYVKIVKEYKMLPFPRISPFRAAAVFEYSFREGLFSQHFHPRPC